MRAWLYYHLLAIQDLVRLWGSTQHHVIIVAGICLPILLLLGLKQGHVADLRSELLTSASGRQVVFWSAQHGELMTREVIERMQQEIPAVELIIPETQRLVTLAAPQADDSSAPRTQSVTLYATREGDPVLAQLEGDVLTPGELAVVLPDSVTAALGVDRGDEITLTVDRQRAGAEGSASVSVVVKAVIPAGPDKSPIGYADLRLLDWLEQYVRGFRVAELSWPALRASVRDAYEGYLVFCETTNSLSDDDLKALGERGLLVEPVADATVKSLWGLLKADSLERLAAYRVFSTASRSNPQRRLTIAPSEIAELTAADDVVIPWNEPQTFTINGRAHLLIGLSLPKRTWLREYLKRPGAAFDYDAETFLARMPAGAAPARGTLSLPLDSEHTCQLRLDAEGEQAKHGQEAASPHPSPLPKGEGTHPILATVPAPLLAHLGALRDGLATYDPEVGLFVAIPEEPVYDKARLYARTIDDVPAICDVLRARRFAVMSESTRINEIHQQDRSLQLLVYVVGIGVFLFGVVTVVSVLLDSTDRKRAAIGILRVMGMSRLGVFYMVAFRAVAIGVLAGAVSVGFGYLIAFALACPVSADSWLAQWKPTVTILITSGDLLAVFVGALACSALGAMFPAWRASRLDPFDAIVEGRFR